MKTIAKWSDLETFGIIPLTGEACSLMYRILCDITTEGKRVIERCLSCELKPPENWNSGAIGSIMLVPEMLIPIAVFALLENGYSECWVIGDSVIGIEATDREEETQRLLKHYQDKHPRRFAYHGQHQDRNRHQMTGRVQ